MVSELGLLSLEEVGRHQAGCYACEADNGFSVTPVTKEVTLLVQCESLVVHTVIFPYLESQHMMLTLSPSLNLVCQSSLAPLLFTVLHPQP